MPMARNEIDNYRDKGIIELLIGGVGKQIKINNTLLWLVDIFQ